MPKNPINKGIRPVTHKGQMPVRSPAAVPTLVKVLLGLHCRLALERRKRQTLLIATSDQIIKENSKDKESLNQLTVSA